ncbi:hypothetical protein ACKWTF_010877 [Chironomus riparius]
MLLKDFFLFTKIINNIYLKGDEPNCKFFFSPEYFYTLLIRRSFKKFILILQSINLSAHKLYMFTTFVKFIQGNLMLKPITCQHTSVYTHFESIKPAGQIVNINTFAITS